MKSEVCKLVNAITEKRTQRVKKLMQELEHTYPMSSPAEVRQRERESRMRHLMWLESQVGGKPELQPAVRQALGAEYYDELLALKNLPVAEPNPIDPVYLPDPPQPRYPVKPKPKLETQFTPAEAHDLFRRLRYEDHPAFKPSLIEHHGNEIGGRLFLSDSQITRLKRAHITFGSTLL